MKTNTLLPCVEGIQIQSIASTGTTIILHLIAHRPAACCPLCGQVSERIHSHYQRTLSDLPWNQVAVRIHLRARKFFCTNPFCDRRVFTEPVPELAARYARKTQRLQAVIYLIGYALGGEAGARVAIELGVEVSPDTLLNRVRQQSQPVDAEPPVRVLGVDDWAFRKGQRYGTILVDLERRRVLDLLPDRTAESLAEWLKAHPGVEIVSRDRGGCYAEGARQGAPQAEQVADRWHLLKNTGDMLERLLTRHYRSLCETARQIGSQVQTDTVVIELPNAPPSPARAPTRAEQESQARRERRRNRYEQVRALKEQGGSLRAISRQTGLSRNTIRQWIEANCFREQAKPAVRQSKLTPYASYLKQRWQEGCHSAVQLFNELQTQGFRGSITLVQRYVQPWRENAKAGERKHRDAPPSSRTVMWWLLGHYSKTDVELRQKQIAFVASLCKLCPEVKVIQEKTLEFARMVKERQVAALNAWLEEASLSPIAELKSFALGLGQDRAAVEAALSSEWSNGQVEGQVNRLKMVKRQMYGRANFDLLRGRVLPMQQAA